MDRYTNLRHRLVAAGQDFYRRGWVMGTSGNFSAMAAARPFALLMTPSGAHKGRLKTSDLLLVDSKGRAKSGVRKPSAETLLHLEIIRARGAAAVLHTHSVWSTILSERHAHAGGLAIEGYEMLKGLEGVKTHEHREWIPILANDQDMTRLAGRLREALESHPAAHAVLLAGHGMYTWGKSVDEAARHVEIAEFLLEVVGRQESRSWPQ
jgi:methylthioribulose-1-phosphate dehydratase